MTSLGVSLEGLAADVRRVGLAGAEVERLETLLAGGPDVASRFHYHPGHVTASGFVAHPSLRCVALVHHDVLDIEIQPGGHLEPTDASVEAGAIREVGEEVGISDLTPHGILDLDLHTFPSRGGRPAHLHFDVRYAFTARTPDLVVGDGVRAVRWVSFDETLTMDPSIARPARRLASLLGW